MFYHSFAAGAFLCVFVCVCGGGGRKEWRLASARYAISPQWLS